MARLDAHHWLVEPGDSWAKIADATGSNRLDIARANGVRIAGHNITDPVVVGTVIHVPLGPLG